MTNATAPIALLGFKHPDTAGASEYRAIYETVADGIEDAETAAEAVERALSMLREFEEWAANMRRSLVERATTIV